MKLLKLHFDHLAMFENSTLELDFYAQDRVPAQDESVFAWERPIYTNNVVAMAGINASGKSVALQLVDHALRAIEGRSIDAGGTSRDIANIFDGNPIMALVLWDGGSMYLLRSHLEFYNDGLGGSSSGKRLRFLEEELLRIDVKTGQKGMLALGCDELANMGEEIARRSMLDAAGRRYLQDDISIIAAYTQEPRSHLYIEAADIPPLLDDAQGGLDDILRTFDSNIRHLSVRDGGRAFELFLATREEPLVLSAEGLEDVLSSGTARGLALVQRAVIVLQWGTYLLLDEIEMHLNRQLVNIVIDLFTSRETNPNGATLVFTTHYPKVLDHLHRKDNVYFLSRNADGRSSAVKVSSRVKRIENKKSEVFVSNYIGGTAPRYTDIAALQRYAASAVGGGDGD